MMVQEQEQEQPESEPTTEPKQQQHQQLLLEEKAEEANFGRSQFKGKDGFDTHFHRWIIQFVALFIKGAFIIARRPIQLLVFLFLPSSFFLAFLIETAGNGGSSSGSVAYPPPTPLSDLGVCDTYDDCIRVAFGPEDEHTRNVMSTFSDLNGLIYGTDVVPLPTVDEAQAFVADRLGRVQYTILFSNESLWETHKSQSGSLGPLDKNMSYAIFFNSSHFKGDARSEIYNANIPLLVLQKTLEESYLRNIPDKEFEEYNSDFGTLWGYPLTGEADDGLNITSPCDLSTRRNMNTLGITIPWILTFALMLLASIPFGLVAEERKKHLFTSLRRMGLIDSAYWAAWFMLFQVLLLIACSLSLITAVLVRPSSSALRAVDLSLAFVVLWVCGTGFMALSFFLASLCSSSSVETSTTFAQFLIAMITIVSCIKPLNSYSYAEDDDTSGFMCIFLSSSYNTIYSKDLLGHTFVQFLVFWLPFFHSSQLATDIVSVIQYKGQSIGLSDIGSPPMPLSYAITSSNTFETKWIQWSLLMLMSNTIVYMYLAWFVAQAMSIESVNFRSVISIILPSSIRRIVLNENEQVMAGDIRGEERLKSAEEKSVRAYKVSKTFSGVQALKEVSFTMKKGEVFVMLGHNGAGKSTLINIITGVHSPTHGKVYLHGLDVERDALDVQQTIGICSQDDLLWDDLTAREHMYLTAAFKGLRWGEELFNAVENVLGRVQLGERADGFCREFSGGMKRRLSVAMSTVGDVEVLFLDEPTTGLDPVSRRRVWETINWMKKDRVVVLTTHNMEEADFLADSIMIMHGGHVRAFGDPLFLKQTYGKGYQVNLTVAQSHCMETHNLIKNVLPDSTCAIDETSSTLSVTVPPRNLQGLPRLFTWLESSQKAALTVKEWGISNTTLEQVFLMLSDLNTEINNVSALQSEASKIDLCPMCRRNMKNTVFLRNLEGRLLLVPDSVCWECITENDSYVVTDEDVNMALQSSATAEERVGKLLVEAQAKAEAVTTQKMLALENSDVNEVFHSLEDGGGDVLLEQEQDQSHGLQVMEVDGPKELTSVERDVSNAGNRLGENQHQSGVEMTAIESNRGGVMSHQAVTNRTDGGARDQIKAIYLKNFVLQSKQKCSNGCSVCFVGTMFLMLYLMSLLFADIEKIDLCDQGYLTDLDCSRQTLIDHIFSGSTNDMIEDDFAFEDDDTVGPNGYTIKYFMIPSGESSGRVEIFAKPPANNFNYGLSRYAGRAPILWSFLSESSELMDLHDALGLRLNSRGLPEAAGGSADSPNAYMFDNQKSVADSVEASQEIEYPRCFDYAADLVVNATQEVVLQNFSDLFADCVFYCENCKATDSSQMNSTATFFDGTLWVAQNIGQGCDEDTCEPYPYAFTNFLTSLKGSFLKLGCPHGVRQYSLNNNNDHVPNTFRAMSYLNLLSNALVEPQLQSFPIQGGISAYGDMNFEAQLISQSLANILTIIAMMLINGFWPLAVWRLAHERSQNIVLMVHTSGMTKLAYMAGMFFFDMTVSILSGVAMIVFAVLLKLSRFEGAPVDYLVAVIVVSSFALNAGGQLMVIAFGKKASVLPLVAPCLMVASVVTSSLLNILVYPDDGDWKWPLSFYPFLAQGRGLYILLVHHSGTPEVDIAISMMVVFGVVALVLTFVLEMEKELTLEIKKRWAALKGDECIEGGVVVQPYGTVTTEDVENGSEGVDSDVKREFEISQAYHPDKDSAAGQESLAIVVQSMRHVFPNGFEAVSNLSLAMKYGECFGLLGPNGAGKSTTISILSGTLVATAGKQYVAGCDMKINPNLIHKYVGICPQFDVVWHDLTVAEHLLFQARQRGVSSNLLTAEVQKAALAVGLDGDGFYTKAGQLSGGMRRRLSIAMSIVGDPPIIFMDEPTTGLDPDNRQQVWHIIQRLKSPNRLILMTTHSMEEAEALCTRIGIMARGILQCIGTAQHLKTKFGKGYTLTVNLLPCENEVQQNDELVKFVVHTLCSGQGLLLSSINRTRKFLVPKDGKNCISNIFRVMELNKAQLGIREWGLSMSTLEDVFISAVEHDTTV